MLTTSKIAGAKATGKPYKLSDAGGLYLLIGASGRKSWKLKYRHGGRERALALGDYPAVSLVSARAAAAAAKAELARGIDPGGEREREHERERHAQENTLEALARDWLSHVGKRWKGTGEVDHLARLERWVLPFGFGGSGTLGAAVAATVKTADLVRCLRAIEAAGKPDAAAKVARALRQIFEFGVFTGRLDESPATRLSAALSPRKAGGHYAALSAKELPGLLRAIGAYRGERQTQLALRLLALTFVRTGELRGARWDEIDFDAAQWRIPGARMKGQREHVVPLSHQAVDVLRELRAINKNFGLVLPGRSGLRPISKNTLLVALKSLGFAGKMTGHGFRAIASTMLNELAFGSDSIERQLAHVEKDRVRAAYDRGDRLPERTLMMQKWADHLDALEQGAAVVPIRRAKA